MPTVKERLRKVVTRLKAEQKISDPAVDRAKKVIAAAKEQAKKKLT